MNRLLTTFILLLTLSVSSHAQTFTAKNSNLSGAGSLSCPINSIAIYGGTANQILGTANLYRNFRALCVC